jgi:hypothetical protein
MFLWFRGIRISAVSKQLRNATIKTSRLSYIVGAVGRFYCVFESSRHEVHNFARYFLFIYGFGVELSRLEPEDTWTEKQRS